MCDAETLARSGARIIQLSVLVVVSTNTSANPTEVGSATGTSLAPSSVAVYLKIAASACGEGCAIRADPRNAERIAERKRTFFMTSPPKETPAACRKPGTQGSGSRWSAAHLHATFRRR